jgi:hypothetical protein
MRMFAGDLTSPIDVKATRGLHSASHKLASGLGLRRRSVGAVDSI